MKPIAALLALLLVMGQASAQAGRGDGADARTNAVLGTPNKVTPVPQTNLFSTTPGLEQQAPGPYGKHRAKDPNVPPPTGKQP